MTTVLAKSLKIDALTALSGDFRNEGKEDYEDEEVQEDDEYEDGVCVVGVWGEINGQECVLTKSGTSNRLLHLLARKVKGVEARAGKSFSLKQYQAVFKKWETASRPFLRSGNDYLSEFLAKLSCVKVPEGETLSEAFRKAQGAHTPAKLQDYPNAVVQHFGCLCRELHSMSNGQPIMLAQKPIAELFGCDPRTISNWIRALMTLDLLKLDKKGFKGKSASTYFYLD